jgi:hypothetical protein
MDFIWNKNRLLLEKEALKANMMKVIQKPKPTGKTTEDEAGKGTTPTPGGMGMKVDPNSVAMN